MNLITNKSRCIDTRIDAIDNLRGIAVLFVFIAHAIEENAFKEYINFGLIGVFIFFLVSGYCIYKSILKLNKSNYTNFIIFLSKRFSKLYPAYWASILAVLIFFPAEFSYQLVLINLSMLQKFFGYPDLQGIYWTLFVEIIYYTIIAIIILSNALKLNVLNFFFFFFFVNLGIAFSKIILNFYIPWAYALMIFSFFYGALLSLFDFNNINYKKLFIFLLLYLLILIINNFVFFDNTLGYSLLIAYIVAIIFFLFFNILNFKLIPLSLLGKVSYSFYLFHHIVIYVMRDLQISNSYLNFFLSFMASFIIAMISHFIFEKKIYKSLLKIIKL